MGTATEVAETAETVVAGGSTPLRARMEAAATARPQAAYLVRSGGTHRLPYGALPYRASWWDRELDRLGVAPGALVGLALSDPMELAEAFLCLIAAGRWVAPVDPAAPAAALERTWRALAPELVVSDGRPGRPSRPSRPSRAACPQDARAPAALPPGGGVVLSSSGTTGAPKVVALDQERLLYTAGVIAVHHELTPADRGFCPLPLFHVNAEVVGLLATLVAGATLVVDDRFHRRGFWTAMAGHHITWINAVPAIIARLCQPELGGPPDPPVPSHIRFVRSASAPLPLAARQRFEERTGLPIVETYGMTEAGSQICANHLGRPRKPGSVGRPTGVALRIHADGRPCQVGETGMVEIRGPGVITQYQTPADNHRLDADGWLRTGDLGYRDQDGDVFLVGRSDDVVNRGGEKVLPREVEEAMLEDRDVAAAAVVGRADPVLGQVPVAYLVVRGVHEPGDARALDVLRRVRACCEAGLPRPKRPVEYVALAALPTGSTGKVQRRRLASADGRIATIPGQ